MELRKDVVGTKAWGKGTVVVPWFRREEEFVDLEA